MYSFHTALQVHLLRKKVHITEIYIKMGNLVRNTDNKNTVPYSIVSTEHSECQ